MLKGWINRAKEFVKEDPTKDGVLDNGLLDYYASGKILFEKLKKNSTFIIIGVFLMFLYIAIGYRVETLTKQYVNLNKEVKLLKVESVVTAAKLMYIRKQSEVIKRVNEEGLGLVESKEPPIKLYWNKLWE